MDLECRAARCCCHKSATVNVSLPVERLSQDWHGRKPYDTTVSDDKSHTPSHSLFVNLFEARVMPFEKMNAPCSIAGELKNSLVKSQQQCEIGRVASCGSWMSSCQR